MYIVSITISCNVCPNSIEKKNFTTRMHSSRMRTGRSLTVYRSLQGGVYLVPGGVYLVRGGVDLVGGVYLVLGGCTWSRGGVPGPGGGVPGPGGCT